MGKMSNFVESHVSSQRMHDGIKHKDIVWSPPHILDLKAGDSEIKAHVDSLEGTSC
jgi:hypothetical protein